MSCHRPGPYHAPFLLWSLALSLLTTLSLLTIPDVEGDSVALLGGQLVAMVIVFYLLARLSLTLPLTAVGGAANPAEAWRLSSGAVGSLIAIPLVAYLGAFVCFIPVALITHVLLPEPFMVVGGYLMMFMGAAVGVSALSVSFRVLSSNSGAVPDDSETRQSSLALPSGAYGSFPRSVVLGLVAFLVVHVALGSVLAAPDLESTFWFLIYVSRALVEGGVAGYVTARASGRSAPSVVLVISLPLFSVFFASAFGLASAGAAFVGAVVGAAALGDRPR